MAEHVRIAIFASGNGTNAEEIINYFQGHPFIEIALLLSNNPNASALQRVKKYNVATKIFSKSQFVDGNEVVNWLKESGITHVVLAGFLWLIPSNLIKSYPSRIINIHPALLPKFGGKGMYGMKVHETVKALGEKETGITIHEVNEHYDEGRILFQIRCEVFSSDTPQQIAEKVHQLEYANYSKVIEQWIKG
ncbi:MAG: phosphoribosylglycinamide formyltransferase [Bacteroidia bacterium]